MTSGGLSGRTAIAGIGQTEFSKESGRTELQLACEAVLAALDDAGLDAADVDGLVTFTMDTSEEMEVAREPRHARAVDVHAGPVRRRRVGGRRDAGRDGGGDRRRRRTSSATARSTNGRATASATASAQVTTLPLWFAWYAPYGLMTPAAWVALHARRYMETYGVTNADFGRIAVVDRFHAATNPGAWFYERPITLEDHQASRWIVEPVLRLLDCCQESDGGVAIVVTSAERARDLRQPPAIITGAAQGATFDGEMMTSYYRDDLTGLPEMGVVGRRLWEMSGLAPVRHVDRVPVRPLHAVRADAARRARVLRARRSEGLGDGGATVARRRVADQHQRRSAR